jgi:DNA-directed RNA polymerase subunit RPC12/RpoP
MITCARCKTKYDVDTLIPNFGMGYGRIPDRVEYQCRCGEIFPEKLPEGTKIRPRED